MRRFLRNLFALFLVLDVVALVVVYKGSVGTHLSAVFVDIRNAVFGKFVTDRAALEAPPETLYAQGFLTDPQEIRAQWREALNNGTRYKALLQKLEETQSTIEKAKLIALTYSRNGTRNDSNGNPEHPYDRTADLLYILATIREPRGLCSDHAHVFNAICSMAGLDSMQVECAHTTSGIYCPELHKWVWIDTEYALMAKWPDGQYMSPLELVEANQNHKDFDYEFFGTPEHVFATVDPKTYLMYRPDQFPKIFAVEWGNNELQHDSITRQVLFLPKPIRQLLWFIVGVQPSLHYLDNDPAFATQSFRIRLGFFAVALCFLIGNLGFPIYVFVTWVTSLVAWYAEPKSAHVAINDIVLETQQQNLAV